MRGLYIVPILSVLVIAVTLVKPALSQTTLVTDDPTTNPQVPGATPTQGGGTPPPGVTNPAPTQGNDTATDDADPTVEMTTAGANDPTKYTIFGLTAVLLPLLGRYYS
ncbi:uncharacterized protein [Ptychodera flava]|uniref:uncharacterized protein n=1 Tax=Ptychodera flava TaxID=63121 RepID=UPI003969BDA1